MSASTGAASGHCGFFSGVAVATAEVWMVSVEVADELPGVIEVGAKVAVAPVGRPLAASVTGLENVPFCAVAVME